MEPSALELILRQIHGFWGSAILASGMRHRVFARIADGSTSAEAIAQSAGISLRGGQALLDGLVGMGLVERRDGVYANSPASARYLVPDSRSYVGGYADMILNTMSDWAALPESVRSGVPLHRQERADPDNSFWEGLVRALAPLGEIPATAAARRLDVIAGAPFRMLDIGGGAGAYSVTWLALNPNGRCTQLDWPNVNALARDYVAAAGQSDGFETLDGDMEHVVIAPHSFDYAIYSNVSHGLPASRNIAMFRRIHAWLKPLGTLVISCMIPSEERTGNPLMMMFGSNLLLNTEQGKLHLRSEYEAWLKEAGFMDLQFEPVIGLPFTLIYAGK